MKYGAAIGLILRLGIWFVSDIEPALYSRVQELHLVRRHEQEQEELEGWSSCARSIPGRQGMVSEL